MTVKELIKELQDCDPKAEVICWSTGPLYIVQELPGYYDGCTTRLIQDKSCDYYNIIGYEYTTKIPKVTLQGMDLDECLFNCSTAEDIKKFKIKTPKFDSYYARHRENARLAKESAVEFLCEYEKKYGKRKK